MVILMNVTDLVVFGTHDENTLAQLADVATRADRVALMADGHLGYVMPIGGVAAYKNKVSVTGVGFDIACGNCAIRTDLHVDQIRDNLNDIADSIQATLSFGVGRNNHCDDAPVDHPLFESPVWDAVPKSEQQSLRAKGRNQLGTIGSGNHYVDVFVGEDAAVWVGVHFGSRGLGHTIASGFLSLSQGKEWGERVPETEALLDLDSELGHDYWQLMTLAGEYAYAGREWVTRKVVQLLGGNELEIIHNHHNFAWKEEHYGEQYVVIRKGATPAYPDQKGFIGGSMGDDAVIVRGSLANSETQREALYSTVHGAGRVMSRSQAAGNRKGTQPGLLNWGMVNPWLESRGVVLRGGGLDEAPQVYRRLPDVLAAQGDTIEVLHTLTPLIVCMAGANEFDPYKD